MPSGSPAGRTLARAVAGVFMVSAMFPIALAFGTDASTWSRWWGYADVAVAALLVVLGTSLASIWDRRITPDAMAFAYRACRACANGLLLLLAVFFLAGDRVAWANALPGFAWRASLFVYLLPAWYVALTHDGDRATDCHEAGD